jgi:hypothetical protein
MQDALNALLDVFSRVGRSIGDLLLGLLDHVHLGGSELVNVLGVSRAADIDEADLTHLEHESSVLHQVATESILQDKQLLFKLVLSLDTVLVLNGFLPHTHELPLVELTKESVSLDMVIRVSFNQPLTQRKEFARILRLVLGDSLARESVMLTVALHVSSNLQIVGIS